MFPPQSPGAGRTDPQPNRQLVPSTGTGTVSSPLAQPFSDAQLLDKWTRWKQESFSQRWLFERQWMRNIWYILNRQWIYFDSKKGQWQDKRLAKWIPRPVTNVCKEVIQAVRATFAAINYGANARPLGEDNKNVIAAGVADDYAPILHESHQMDAVMDEFDFWLLATGNAFLHAGVERDRKHGVLRIPYERCTACGMDATSDAISDAKQLCPSCGAPGPFEPATNEDGSPKQEERLLPKGVTIALSPFEVAFPLIFERFDQVPIVIRMRWRDKSYFEQHEDEEVRVLARTLAFGKSPSDRSMQIFKALPFQNDLGIAPPYYGSGGANAESDGIVEFEVWVRPCVEFPQGYVVRFLGDTEPRVLHVPSENIPGPLPITDAEGNPVFPFEHARYDSVGGRVYGSAILDPVIQKQDQLNQLDSHMLMIIGRMANPVWLEPKGAEVEKFTGEPGLVVKWNPLVAGGNAKPERIPGENISESAFTYRAIIKQEIEELTGTYDILKGQRPTGVEAFAALSLLLERGQARHASAFKARGLAYKGWFKTALEIERTFGPDKRVRAVMMPNRAWAFQTFQKADLAGAMEIIIEDGTLAPKTSLGERAAIEHLRQLGLLNPADPDQVMVIYQKFGQQALLPGLDAQVQEAWMNLDTFEKWIANTAAVQTFIGQYQQTAQQAMATGGMVAPPQIPGMTYKRWYNPQIHRQELVKWCLSDSGRNIFATKPGAEQFVDAYLQQLDAMILMSTMGQLDPTLPQPNGPGSMRPDQLGQGGPPTQAGGAGAAMANSNRNAAGAGPSSSGSAGAQQNGQQITDPRELAGTSRAISYLEKTSAGRGAGGFGAR